MKRTILICVVAFMMSTGMAMAQDTCSISLDHVDGLHASGQIPISNNEITFWLRLTNNSSSRVNGLTNGFKISGSDPSVTWNVTDIGYDPIFEDYFFQLVFEIQTFSLDGQGADTIGFGGSVMLDPGMPRFWDEVGYWITLSVTDQNAAGHVLCLDSTWYPYSGEWMWFYPSYAGGSVSPSWDGPHCFELYNCCQGMRGNIDCDPSGEVTISDLTYLVDYMFGGGPAPVDMATADFGDDGHPDISDLIYLVEYMFRGGPALPQCP